jgi:hypothetical protein
MNVLAITSHNGIRLAELGFLLAAIAGGLEALAAVTPGSARGARLTGGVALAAGSVLLIIATRWGHFG